MSKKTVKAVCIVEIQVACDDVWSDDTTMSQIVHQAEQSSTGKVQRLFRQAVTDDKDLSVKRVGLDGITLIGVKKIVTQVVEDRT